MIRIPQSEVSTYLADHCQYQQEPVLIQQQNGLWTLAFQPSDVGFPFPNYLAVAEQHGEPAAHSIDHWMSVIQPTGIECVKLDLRKGGVQ